MLWRRTIWKFSILILSAVGASFYLMTELRTNVTPPRQNQRAVQNQGRLFVGFISST